MNITVGKGSCGIAAGASEIFDLLKQGLSDGNDCGCCGNNVEVTGCIGMCWLEPIVNVEDVTFVKVNKEAAEEILKYIKGEKNNAENEEGRSSNNLSVRPRRQRRRVGGTL